MVLQDRPLPSRSQQGFTPSQCRVYFLDCTEGCHGVRLEETWLNRIHIPVSSWHPGLLLCCQPLLHCNVLPVVLSYNSHTIQFIPQCIFHVFCNFLTF